MMKNKTPYQLSISLLAVITAFSTYACSNKCEYDRECPFDRVCLAGTCSMSCAYNPNACSGGEVCVSGTCVHTCTGDGDCNGTMYCAPTGICTAPITTDNNVTHEPQAGPEDGPGLSGPDDEPENTDNHDAGSEGNGDAASDKGSQNP